jgi:ribonuclease-3 family protein
MEESLNFSNIKRNLQIEDKDIRTFSPLSLAYIGDTIFDLLIRSVVLANGNTPVSKMHKACSEIVCATSQAAIIDAIFDELTEEEKEVVTRGRNAKSKTTAKNASVLDYRKATSLEALLGYLYMEEKVDRLYELTTLGLKKTGRI